MVPVPAPPRRRVRLIAAALALSFAGGLTATSATAAAPVSEIAFAPRPEATVQQNVFMFVNAHRARVGAAPVRYNMAATIAAQRHANDMARMGRMTHIGSDGSNGGQRLTRAGFQWSSWGENIAVGQPSSSAVVNAWLNSPGHRANLLNSRFRWMGVGIAWGHGTIWWCVVLAS